jgi:hypothetical protein
VQVIWVDCMNFCELSEDRRGRCNSLNNMQSQAVVRHMERYSASVLERETTLCFLADQEMRFEPRKMPYSEVERLSSGFLA